MSTDYTLNDVRNVAAKIRRLCPNVHVDDHGDYGFALSVRKGDKAYILFRPARDEGDITIRASDEEINRLIEEWRS